MNVKDYQDCYYDMTRTASEIGRTLGLAGLGVIWIFKLDSPEGVSLAKGLVQAAIWIVSALALDLVQYLYLAVTWLAISYVYERKHGHEATGLTHPALLPRVAELIFAAKIVCLGVGYWHIFGFLAERIRVA